MRLCSVNENRPSLASIFDIYGIPLITSHSHSAANPMPSA